MQTGSQFGISGCCPALKRCQLSRDSITITVLTKIGAGATNSRNFSTFNTSNAQRIRLKIIPLQSVRALPSSNVESPGRVRLRTFVGFRPWPALGAPKDMLFPSIVSATVSSELVFCINDQDRRGDMTSLGSGYARSPFLQGHSVISFSCHQTRGGSYSY